MRFRETQAACSVRKITTNMALYRASPLNTYDSIRVLYVHQGRSDTGIEASITIVQLSSKPDFIALSYTWQSPVDEQHASYNKYKHGAYSISVDGERLPIYANLHEALLRMRSMHYHLPLWIDAICIDQKNDSERNHQLSLMPSIYLQASRTVIWLGESELDIRMAVQTLDSLQCQVIEGNLSLSTDYALDVIRKIPGRNRRAIGKLCRRRWFKRLWTLQEVLLPAKTVTLCGEVELDISLLASIATLALQLPAKLEITAFMQQDLGGAAQLRAMAGIAAWLGVAWRGGGFGSRAFLRYPKIDHDLEVSTDFKWLVALEQLVHECRQRECSKSGDHILAPLAFALHEKFAPTDAESVSILENARKLLDHRSSTVDLYIGFTRFLIASMKNLDILSRVDVTASQTRICRTKVPSWVPPFNAEGVTSLIDDVLFRQYDAASFLGTYIPAQGNLLRSTSLCYALTLYQVSRLTSWNYQCAWFSSLKSCKFQTTRLLRTPQLHGYRMCATRDDTNTKSLLTI